MGSNSINSTNELEKQVQDIEEAQKQYDAHIKSPWIYLGSSIGACAGMAVVMWPLDVLKTHIFAGKETHTAYKRLYSPRGLGFGIAGAGIFGFNICDVYLREYGQELSPTKKALITVAPFSLVPALSVFEMLKINSQITQQDMTSCYRSVTKNIGLRGLLRGMIPYTGLFAFQFACALPAIYFDKSQPTKIGRKIEPQEEISSGGIAALLFGSLLAVLVISTPLEVYKTRVMLGETNIKLRNIPRNDYLRAFAARTVYCLIFTIMVTQVSNVVVLIAHGAKEKRFVENKMIEKYGNDDSFDGFIPDSRDEMKPDDLIRKVFIQDG